MQFGLKLTHCQIALGVVEVGCVAAVIVVSNQHFSVLVGPEAAEVNQDAGYRVTLATVHQVLECDPTGVFRLHHVKDLILKTDSNQHPPKSSECLFDLTVVQTL